MKKKLFQAILYVLLLCMFFGSNAFAVEYFNSPSYRLKNTVKKIDEKIADFYYCKDVSGLFKPGDLFSSDMAVLLADKINTNRHLLETNNSDKENYVVDVIEKSRDFDDKDNILNLKYQVLSSFNYVGMDFPTTISEEVNVSFDCAKRQIVDMYTPMNYYDESVRDFTDTENEFKMSQSIVKKQNRLFESIDKINRQINDVDSLSYTLNNTLTSSNLNSSAVVSWTRNNYNKGQPSPGNSSVPYFDFSDIIGSYDCTNFVSHACLAGGAIINDTGISGISSTGWYYRNVNNRSSSWSGVNQFYQHMTSNTLSNTAAGQSYIYTHNGTWWGLGNVLQFDFNGDNNFDHSTIITRKVGSSDGSRWYAYVTGRTSDTSYNNNVKADDLSTHISRVLHIYNR